MFRAKILVILVFMLTISWINSLAQREDIRKLLKESYRELKKQDQQFPKKQSFRKL